LESRFGKKEDYQVGEDHQRIPKTTVLPREKKKRREKRRMRKRE